MADPFDTDPIGRYFAGSPAGLAICRAVAAVVAGLGPAEVRVSTSQVAFRRRTGFAYVWRPGQYVRSDVPAVLSVALPEQLVSARFKQVVHPSPRVWMHHLEVHESVEIDEQVAGWLRAAYAAAG